MTDAQGRFVVSTIRHAQTTYGAQGRYAGSRDVPLSEDGVADARAVAPAIAKLGLDVIVTSPLARAMATAKILAPTGVPIVADALTVERNYGAMEGHTWEEVHRLTPPVLFIQVGDDTHSVNPPRGEPFERVWARAELFRDTLFSGYAGKRVLVVAHSVFLQMLHGVLRGTSCIEALLASPANLELTTFTFVGNCLTEDKGLMLCPSEGPSF